MNDVFFLPTLASPPPVRELTRRVLELTIKPIYGNFLYARFQAGIAADRETYSLESKDVGGSGTVPWKAIRPVIGTDRRRVPETDIVTDSPRCTVVAIVDRRCDLVVGVPQDRDNLLQLRRCHRTLVGETAESYHSIQRSFASFTVSAPDA